MLLPCLQELPKTKGVDGLDTGEAITRIRTMDRDHFAIEVSQATEEALEALFQARNVPDELNEAFVRAFSSIAKQGTSLHERYEEMLERGSQSVTKFVSNLKGKVAELKAEAALEERYPDYDFKLAESAAQPGWDIIGTSPDGPDMFFQVKAGAAEYTDRVVDAMQEHSVFVFPVSSEIYQRIEELHPELLERVVDIGPAAELTEDVKGGLVKLATNLGVDVSDSWAGVLPFVGEVVLGIRLIWDIVRTERELTGVDLTDRSRVNGVRAMALMSRFGISQVCMWSVSAGGTAAGSVMPVLVTSPEDSPAALWV